MTRSIGKNTYKNFTTASTVDKNKLIPQLDPGQISNSAEANKFRKKALKLLGKKNKSIADNITTEIELNILISMGKKEYLNSLRYKNSANKVASELTKLACELSESKISDTISLEKFAEISPNKTEQASTNLEKFVNEMTEQAPLSAKSATNLERLKKINEIKILFNKHIKPKNLKEANFPNNLKQDILKIMKLNNQHGG